jgi:drug/metabolite transporter (DMT)-like permease
LALKDYLLYVATVLIWGVTFYGIKLQLGPVPEEVSIAYRFFLAAAILTAWCLVRGRSLRLPLRAHPLIALLGMFLFSLNYIATYFATGYIASGLVALAFSAVVILNIFNGALFLGSPVHSRVLVGAAAGVSGIALAFWPDLAAFDFSGNALTGLGLTLLATVSTSLGNITAVYTQRKGLPTLQTIALAMAYGAAFMAAAALLEGKPFRFDGSARYVGSLIFLAVFGSAAGFACYFTLLVRIGADRAGYGFVMFPVIALVISAFLEDFEWNLTIVAAMALVMGGNVLVMTKTGPGEATPPVSSAS